MYKTIMVPVDLGHSEQLDKAISTAADLAKVYGSKAVLVGVTQSSPTEVARTPKAFAEKLAAFAQARSEALGVSFAHHTEISHDIAVDLDDVLERTIETLSADLVVMASHQPGFAEHLFASNAGYLASHAKVSVFVVR